MLHWLFKRAPDHGVHEARRHSADADANLPHADELERQVRQLQRENNFARNIKRAMEGR